MSNFFIRSAGFVIDGCLSRHQFGRLIPLLCVFSAFCGFLIYTWLPNSVERTKINEVIIV